MLFPEKTSRFTSGCDWTIRFVNEIEKTLQELGQGLEKVL